MSDGIAPQRFRKGQTPGAWRADRLQEISTAAAMVHNFTVAPPLTLNRTAYGMRLGIRMPSRGRPAAVAAAVEAGAQIRTVVLTAGSTTLLGVRAVRYADSPPVEGEYEWDGEAFAAFPEFGASFQEYAGLLSSDDPPNPNTPFLLAYSFGTDWLVALPPDQVAEPFGYFRVIMSSDSRLNSTYFDTMPANKWLGLTSGGDDIWDSALTVIAKPFAIRTLPFNDRILNGFEYSYSFNRMSRTSTRTSDRTDVETQEVTPSYYTWQVIETERRATGIVGVSWLDATNRRFAKTNAVDT